MHTALNFTGQAGPAGDTWLTKWTPGGALAHFNGRCGTGVAASILIHPFNNRKGAGLVALLNDANPGDKGLALIVYDNGNTDAVQLRQSTRSRGSWFRFPIRSTTFPSLRASRKMPGTRSSWSSPWTSPLMATACSWRQP